MLRESKDSASSYSDLDVAYMQSLSAAVVQRSPKYLVMTVAIITLFVIFCTRVDGLGGD